jgi:hypothetical protein
MTRAAGSRVQLASHVLARHARATPRAPSTPSRVVSKIFAERAAGPAVAQKTSHAEREHAAERPSAASV